MGNTNTKPAPKPPVPTDGWPEWFQRSAECPICLEVPRDAIYLCLNGHALCKKCHDIQVKNKDKCPMGSCDFPESPIRSLALEDMVVASKYQFSCRNGCNEQHPKATIDAHERSCIVKTMECPQRCGKRCSRLNLSDHMRSHHSEILRKTGTRWRVTRLHLGDRHCTAGPMIMHDFKQPFFSRVIITSTFAMIVVQVDKNNPVFDSRKAHISVKGVDGTEMAWSGLPYDLEDTVAHMLEKKGGLCILKGNLESITDWNKERTKGVLTVNTELM